MLECGVVGAEHGLAARERAAFGALQKCVLEGVSSLANAAQIVGNMCLWAAFSALSTLSCNELWEKSPERRQKVSCLERLLHQDKLQCSAAGTRKSQDGLLSVFPRSAGTGASAGRLP